MPCSGASNATSFRSSCCAIRSMSETPARSIPLWFVISPTRFPFRAGGTSARNVSIPGRTTAASVYGRMGAAVHATKTRTRRGASDDLLKHYVPIDGNYIRNLIAAPTANAAAMNIIIQVDNVGTAGSPPITVSVADAGAPGGALSAVTADVV